MLVEAFARHYPGDNLVDFRAAAVDLCEGHLAADLGDANMLVRLCSADHATHWQALSEVLIARHLSAVGLEPRHVASGPDFRIGVDGVQIGIEVICPTPANLPASWLGREPGSAISVPHEAILLRWTAAIKEKAEKLLGPVDQPEKGYLAKGFVAHEEAYVIAVNARLLRTSWPELYGISTYPYAAEAVFPIGPFEITMNRETLEVTHTGHQLRTAIAKPNGAKVPATAFMDPRFAPVSAIWATDIGENGVRDRAGDMAVVHNPLAARPIPRGLLPAHREYVAESDGDSYRIEMIAGRLATG